jgi:uncharacterized protein YggT (Ycf19 family)
MTGSGLLDFLIAVVGLCIIVGLIFLALEKIAPDEWFKKIGRYAVGGAALLAFLVAIKGVLFGGGGLMVASPIAVLECAIGIIVLVVVVMIIYMAIDKFAPPEFATTVKYVVGAIALIVILLLTEKALFGGGLGIINGSSMNLRLKQ